MKFGTMRGASRGPLELLTCSLLAKTYMNTAKPAANGAKPIASKSQSQALTFGTQFQELEDVCLQTLTVPSAPADIISPSSMG